MVDKQRQKDEMVRHSVEKNGNKNGMGDFSEIYAMWKCSWLSWSFGGDTHRKCQASQGVFMSNY